MAKKKIVKQPYQVLVNISRNLAPQMKASLLSLLEQVGKPIKFDWENGSAPSIASSQFDDDITDCYVSKVWAENGLVKANLHAYYLGDDRDDIDLGDECLGVDDYTDIMEYVLASIAD